MEKFTKNLEEVKEFTNRNLLQDQEFMNLDVPSLNVMNSLTIS